MKCQAEQLGDAPCTHDAVGWKADPGLYLCWGCFTIHYFVTAAQMVASADDLIPLNRFSKSDACPNCNEPEGATLTVTRIGWLGKCTKCGHVWFTPRKGVYARRK